MDIIRRNTDYALRAMVHLAHHYQAEEAVSARAIAAEQGFTATLASKLLQRLQKAGLVESVMGVKGGFRLSRTPDEISVGRVIEAIQGPIRLSECLLGVTACCKYGVCPIRRKFGQLQTDISTYLEDTSLGELVNIKIT